MSKYTEHPIYKFKQCKQCKFTKPLRMFRKCCEAVDGHEGRCKECAGKVDRLSYKIRKGLV